MLSWGGNKSSGQHPDIDSPNKKNHQTGSLLNLVLSSLTLLSGFYPVVDFGLIASGDQNLNSPKLTTGFYIYFKFISIKKGCQPRTFRGLLILETLIYSALKLSICFAEIFKIMFSFSSILFCFICFIID